MIAPTLIIGLGGTGSDIVSRIEKQYRDSDERIGFALFDTDANELRKIKDGGFTGALIQTSENLTVGEYLNSDPEAGEIWFPVHKTLNRKTLTEGAGQVRAISRLAFEAMLRAGGMEPLHQEIDNLYHLNSEDLKQSLRIVVVSSLAGGTGSGLTLPIGMYLRNYLIETYQQYSSIIRGFFIMPEIFNRVSKNPSERNSLQANAYAALKELNAFLMRGDGSLDERFTKTIRFEIPRPGSMEKMSLDTMPYDYCFLFDKRSCNNEILSSFEEYKEFAVESVKGLALEETSRRINSSEDNIIKELCEEIGNGGCNRYCGLGTAKLVYPYEDVVTYLSDILALESLDTEWLKYDREYEKRREQENRMMKVGPVEKLTTRSDVYKQIISSTEKDTLASCVERQCRTGNSIEQRNYKWHEYIQNLIEKIDSYYIGEGTRAAKYKNEIVQMVSSLETIENIKQKGNELLAKTREYMEYADSFIREHGKEMAAILFHTDKSEEKYHLNYWLKSYSKDEYMHPVTMRYFLYQIPELLDIAVRGAKEELIIVDNYLENDFEIKLDDTRTRDVIEDRDAATEKLVTEKTFFNGRTWEEQKTRLQTYTYDADFVTRWIQYNMRIKVLEEGKRFVEKLIEQYEFFFDNLQNLITTIKEEKKGLEECYKRTEGRTIRYVGMTKYCRKAYEKMVVGKSNAVSVDAALCNTIMEQIGGFCVQSVYDEDLRVSDFIRKIAAAMRSYWKKTVKETMKEEIDINVLEAVRREKQYELKYAQAAETEKIRFDVEDDNDNNEDEYLKKVILQMWKLSTPFITKPIGEEPRTIRANCYHKSLEEKQQYRQLINECLRDQGGVASDAADRYSIRFVQAIYGLSLTDFGKFSANRSGKYNPDKSQEGSLFSAYFELVNHIHPNSRRTTCLSPHLDRNWHYINVMPEISRDEQRRIEMEISKAMVYGLVLNSFTNKRTTKFASSFKYLLNFAEEELICNDDVCDTFAEVLQALIKNHMIVERILEDAERDIRRKITAAKDLKKSYLVECLNNFHIREVDRLLDSRLLREFKANEITEEEYLENRIGAHSILEIGLLYSQTATKEDYDETFALTLIRAAFQVLEDTVLLYLNNEDDVKYCLSDMLIEQYKLYEDNLDKLNKIWADIRLEPMAEQTRLLTGQKLRTLGCLEEAEWIMGNLSREQYEKLRRERDEEDELRKLLAEHEAKEDREKYSSALINKLKSTESE